MWSPDNERESAQRQDMERDEPEQQQGAGDGEAAAEEEGRVTWGEVVSLRERLQDADEQMAQMRTHNLHMNQLAQRHHKEMTTLKQENDFLRSRLDELFRAQGLRPPNYGELARLHWQGAEGAGQASARPAEDHCANCARLETALRASTREQDTMARMCVDLIRWCCTGGAALVVFVSVLYL